MTMNQIHETRESWMQAAINVFRETFEIIDATLPEKIHVSVGLPDRKYGKGSEAIGQCWPKSRSEDGINHVFICPTISDPVQVLNILVHELIHVSDDCKSGHRGHFARCKSDLGLGGKCTSTTPGELQGTFEAVAKALGAFPHGGLIVGRKKKPPTTIKAICHSCGWHCRISHKWAMLGLPNCPGCDVPTFED